MKEEDFDKLKAGDVVTVRQDDDGTWTDRWIELEIKDKNITSEGWRILGFGDGEAIRCINFDVYVVNNAIY